LFRMRKLGMNELGRKTVTAFWAAEKNPVTVVLDNVRSMHNVGSVFRTADSFLIEQVILCGYTPQPPHRDIQKTALGATETVKWLHFSQTTEAVALLKQQGYHIVAVEQVENSIPLHHFRLPAERKTAIIFGNEVNGVGSEVLALCDEAIEIPQAGMKHSLNISVAAGIVIWQLFAQLAEAAERVKQVNE
jgi:23S rRNA (guanosine2251-2'-O)-methyltransferase